jgi:hypothetical protein
MEAKGDRIEAGELDYQTVLWELRRSRLFADRRSPSPAAS